MRSKDRKGRRSEGKRTVRRASYPPDPKDVGPWAQGAQPQDPTLPFSPDALHHDPWNALGDDPWQAPFLLQEGVFDWQDDTATQETRPQVQTPEMQTPFTPFDSTPLLEQTPLENPPGRKAWSLLLLASLLVVFACIWVIASYHRPNQVLRQQLQQMASPVFAEGIVVDGQDIGGLTRQEAQQKLANLQAQADAQLRITVQVDGQAFVITSQEIPQKQSLSAVLDQAYAIGRQSFAWGLGANRTPFGLRVLHRERTKRDKAYLYTSFSYDPKDVRAVADSIASQVSKPAINAVIQAFDFTSRAFSVTQDVTGRELSANEVYTALTAALNSGQRDVLIQLNATPILPKVTSTDLKNRFVRLAEFSTRTDSNQDRNHNIALAAQAINNTTLMPGESFSFNKATGERTQEKGYRGAPAILGGRLIDDTGGGVCQASTTLFYAAASAGLTITERNAHAWPVSYVDMGLDATVNWPNLDLQFKNGKDTPVFITAAYQNRQITVVIYGMLEAPGESLRLETKLVASQNPPAEPLYQQNPDLPPGTTQELMAARTGYEVETYRVYLRNGQEYRREKLFTSIYNMVQQVIEYN